MTDLAVADAGRTDAGPTDTGRADAGQAGDARAAAPVRADVAEFADSFVRFMRMFNRARSRMLEATAHDVEWSSHVVLKCLQTEGPMRAGSLADAVLSDPSTVSRQVASLVRDGLLERRADPDDGRASLLVLTPRAHEVLAEHDRIRLEYFADMLSDWSERDLREFGRLLGRFAENFNAMDHDWVRTQIAASTARQEGTN